MRCAVFGCRTNNENKEKFGFHCFPKDPKLVKQWVQFCHRKEVFNPKTARICEFHFAAEDIERNLQYEMGFATRKHKQLREGTIPKIYNGQGETDSNLSQDRFSLVEKRNTKKLVTSLLIVKPVSRVPPEPEPKPVELVEIKYENTSSASTMGQIEDVHETIKKLKRDNFILTEAKKTDTKEIVSLKNKLMKSEFERKNLEEKLSEIFTPSQIRKLKGDNDKKIHWTEEDIRNSFTIYSASPKAYILLREKKYPIPAVRTLQNWSQKYKQSYIKESESNEMEI